MYAAAEAALIIQQQPQHHHHYHMEEDDDVAGDSGNSIDNPQIRCDQHRQLQSASSWRKWVASPRIPCPSLCGTDIVPSASGEVWASGQRGSKPDFRVRVITNDIEADLRDKDFRLLAERERLERVGPLTYYSEWVKAWKKDTSREAVQKHFEETGEDENTQLIEMFTHQTDREYRIMMGTDPRISRDPLAMQMKEEQIKQIWGGDPVYPTVNYIQDPDVVIDYRGPDFHEPTPDMLDYLKELGKITPREEFEKTLAKEKTEEIEVSDMDEAMAQAVDIGEKDDEAEDSETEGADEDKKLVRNWSVVKSTPQLRKSKGKPKKDDLSLEEAINESENLTDFILDFDEDE